MRLDSSHSLSHASQTLDKQTMTDRPPGNPQNGRQEAPGWEEVALI